MKPSEMFTSPRQWTKGRMAKTFFNWPCSCDSMMAAKWCLLGRAKLLDVPYDCLCRAARELFSERVGRYGGIVDFNDHPATTFDDVQRVLQLADKYYANSP